jgi:hypothetical protein
MMKQCDHEFGHAALVEHETVGLIVDINNLYNDLYYITYNISYVLLGKR